MKDLFDNDVQSIVEVNIYADEVQSRPCPYNWEEWIYIWLIVENIKYPLLKDIVIERFCWDINMESPYFEKNNKTVHWVDICSADSKNICKRWTNYFLDPSKSSNSLYAYILGINISKLNQEEFHMEDQFNSVYNRFFRSAVIYSLKTFFPGKNIIVKNIFHEEGQQKDHKYFPWHAISQIKTTEENISFECSLVTFLPKDHKLDEKSNVIQLCDMFLWVSTSIIHWIEYSNRSKYREEIINLFFPLIKRMIDNPWNKNSRYGYSGRIAISFFPKHSSWIWDPRRFTNQFYKDRNLYYEEQKLVRNKINQPSLF